MPKADFHGNEELSFTPEEAAAIAEAEREPSATNRMLENAKHLPTCPIMGVLMHLAEEGTHELQACAICQDFLQFMREFYEKLKDIDTQRYRTSECPPTDFLIALDEKEEDVDEESARYIRAHMTTCRNCLETYFAFWHIRGEKEGRLSDEFVYPEFDEKFCQELGPVRVPDGFMEKINRIFREADAEVEERRRTGAKMKWPSTSSTSQRSAFQRPQTDVSKR